MNRRECKRIYDDDIEDTSDAVYQKLHQSQEKAEKERMTSLYKKGLSFLFVTLPEAFFENKGSVVCVGRACH